MTIHTIKVRNRRISTDNRMFAANGVASDYLSLDLDGDWDGLTVSVILGEGSEQLVAEWEGDPLEFPSELAKPGWVPVSIVGMAPDGGERMTTFRCDRLLQVAESGGTGEVMIGGIMV